MKKVLSMGAVFLGLLWAHVASAAATLAPAAAAAQDVRPTGFAACGTIAQYGLAGAAGCFLGVLQSLTVLLMAASVVYIVYGAFNMIRSEEKREEGKNTVIYGVIGLFVMISIWGFVNILDSTFGFSQYQANDFKVPSLVPSTP